ncbi:MAG: hypothetical protein H7A36_07435 [Chlamydiales bacterium]|nr:hypothetical protein [Chlamydiales bacterium]
MPESTSPIESEGTNPLQAGRLVKALEKEKLDVSRVDSVIELIQYQSRAENLTPPLYTARAQQEANEKTAEAQSQKKLLGTGKQKKLSPLMKHELDSYEDLIKYLLNHVHNKKEQEQLEHDLHLINKMRKKGEFSKKDLEELNHMINTFNEMASKMKDEAARKQYWAKAAMMFEVMEKLAKKLQRNPKNSDLRKALQQLQNAANLNKGMASAKADGNQSLANLFRDAILHHYMPEQEQALAEIAELLKFMNEGAMDDNDLLNILSDLAQASNDFSLSSMLHGGTKGNFPGGNNIASQLNNEKNAVSRDEQSLSQASKKIDQQLNQLEKENKDEKNPKIKKMREKLIDQLKGYKKNIQACQANLQKLGKLLSQLKVTVNPDGTGSISGPPGWQKALSGDEDAVVNGTGTPTMGGLSKLYSQITSDQQDYSNQSQTQQMQLQLIMTEIQQEWTIVATCMTTLNQAMMTIAQGIYK